MQKQFFIIYNLHHETDYNSFNQRIFDLFDIPQEERDMKELPNTTLYMIVHSSYTVKKIYDKIYDKISRDYDIDNLLVIEAKYSFKNYKEH